MNTVQKPLWVATLTPTPVGAITLAASREGLMHISVGYPFSAPSAEGQPPNCLQTALDQFAEYFDRRRQVFDLPIDWCAAHSPFASLVWRACLEIPYGQTRTYAQLARNINRPNSSRAVGRALAANPLLILIPCHRVIGTDGKLHGYAAPDGIQTKTWLLRLEDAH